MELVCVSDPFALPVTLKSDPVRGPILIDINTDCLLEEDQSEIFEAFPESTWQQRLFLFREAIAQRYGFVNSTTDKSSQPSSAIFSTFHQYVHATGNMFLLIPTQMKEELKGIQAIYFVQDVLEVLDFKNEPFFRESKEDKVLSQDMNLDP